jgi:tetratricopeptide (TPR) repeat protein
MRPRRLFVFAALLFLASVAVAQNPPEPVLVRPSPSARIAPPAPDATPAQLEQYGDELRVQKAFPDALDYYRAGLKKTPSAVLQNKVGITELQMMRYKDAVKSFNKSIKMDRSYSDAYNNLGVVYYIEKKYSRAIKYYRKAIELRDVSASYHTNLGTAYFARREFVPAMAEYARAMELDPEVFEKKSQSGVAAQMSSPEDRAYYSYMLAKMYARAGNFERAIIYLRKSIEDGYKGIDSVYKDPEFAELRKEPRFAELMASKPASIPQ